jgi:hypothetical protein
MLDRQIYGSSGAPKCIRAVELGKARRKKIPRSDSYHSGRMTGTTVFPVGMGLRQTRKKGHPRLGMPLPTVAKTFCGSYLC